MSKNLQRDASFAPIYGNHAMLESKSYTFAALTTGAVGQHGLFTVTGDVLATVFAVCSVSLNSDGAATISVGDVTNVDTILAVTTATGIDAGEVWVDNAPATIEALPSTYIISSDITADILVEAIKAGTVVFYCLWRPLSTDGNVVAA